MSLEAVRAGIVSLAKAIGRWIVEFLAEHGVDILIGYMIGKVSDFRRRLARAVSQRRRRWLTGRISRWTLAVEWLREHKPMSCDAVVCFRRVCSMPTISRQERRP